MQAVLHSKMYTFVFRYHLLQETWLLQELGDLKLDSFPLAFSIHRWQKGFLLFTERRWATSAQQSEHRAQPASAFFIAQENPWRWGRNMAVLQHRPVARKQKDVKSNSIFFFHVRHFLCFVSTCLNVQLQKFVSAWFLSKGKISTNSEWKISE